MILTYELERMWKKQQLSIWKIIPEFAGSVPGTTRKKSSGSGTGSTQPRDYNWKATWQKSSGSCLENREYGRRDPSRRPRGILYPQKLAITSPTSGGRSVGIVRSRTRTMEFFYSRIRIQRLEESYKNLKKSQNTPARFEPDSFRLNQLAPHNVVK
jgi:hypothetical protein